VGGVVGCVRRLSPVLFSGAPAPSGVAPLSLHDALPICSAARKPGIAYGRIISVRYTRRPRSRGSLKTIARNIPRAKVVTTDRTRSEEHTSELQSRENLVCRLLLEKKNIAAKLGRAVHGA